MSLKLLNELSNDLLNQIFKDYDIYGDCSFIFFVDADDVLDYIDAFGFLYGTPNRFSNIDYQKIKENIDLIADRSYAFEYLFFSQKKIYFFKEYGYEMSQHEVKFNKYRELGNNIIDKVIKDEQVDDDYFRNNISKIFFVLSGYSQSIYQKYNKLKKEKLSTDSSYEKDLFQSFENFEEEDLERINYIFQYFKNRSESDLLDAVCLYKTILLNEKNVDRKKKRFIYFSSTKKAIYVIEDLKSDILNYKASRSNPKNVNNDDLKNSEEFKKKTFFKWLLGIMSQFPDEQMLFLRNKAYSLGFSMYKSFSKQELQVNSKELKSTFTKICRTDDPDNYFSTIANNLRDSFKNDTILLDKLKEFRKLDFRVAKKGDTFLAFKDLAVKFFENTDEKIEEIVQSNQKNIIVRISILDDLIQYFSGSEERMQIDRGRDKIMSLINSIPPFLCYDGNLSDYDSIEKSTSYKKIVMELISYAYNRKNHLIETRDVLQLFKEKNKEMETKDPLTHLLLIFLLIFVKYKSKETGLDSNQEAIEQLDYFIFKHEQLEGNKSKTIFLLREAKILWFWAKRRTGTPIDPNELIKIEAKHVKEIERENYEQDYRFLYSLFLWKIDYFYSFISINRSKPHLIYNYLIDIIKLGKKIRKKIPKVQEVEYYSKTNRTILNALSFVYCLRLDFLLYCQESGVKYDLFVFEEWVPKIKGLKKKLKKSKKKRKGMIPNSEGYTFDSEKNPVFLYVEAYIEYLEFWVDKDYGKLEYAERDINKAIKKLINGKEERSFEKKCFTKLKDLIVSSREKSTNNYVSFIMTLDA